MDSDSAFARKTRAETIDLRLPESEQAFAQSEKAFAHRLTTEAGVVQIATATARPRDRAIVYARAYHHISEAFQEVVPGLDWCGYAKWSSRQVSQMFDLRTKGPFLSVAIRRMGLRFAAGAVGALFRRLVGGREYVTSLRLANQVIFAEMAVLHVMLLEHYRERPNDSPNAAEVVDRVRARSATIFARLNIVEETSGLDRGDRKLLERAVDFYHLARSNCGHPEAAAEYLLGTCTCLSAYEQRRAQKALEFAFYRPVRLLLVVWWKRLVWTARGLLHPRQMPLPLYIQTIYKAPHPAMAPPVRSGEGRLVRFLTGRVLQISTPVSDLVLGRPLRVPTEATRGSAQSAVPDITFPEVLHEMKPFEVPAEFQPDVRSRNWLDYTDRMKFVITYFRIYQGVEKMKDDPYENPRWRGDAAGWTTRCSSASTGTPQASRPPPRQCSTMIPRLRTARPRSPERLPYPHRTHRRSRRHWFLLRQPSPTRAGPQARWGFAD